MAKKKKGMIRKYTCDYCGKTYAIDYYRRQHEKNCKENDEKTHPTTSITPEIIKQKIPKNKRK